MSHRDVGEKVILTMVKACLHDLGSEALAEIATSVLGYDIEYIKSTDTYRIHDKEPSF